MIKKVCCFFVVVILLLSIIPFGAEAGDCPVVINEVMASNKSVIKDSNSEYSDWIELYNRSNFTCDLSGKYLSDSKKNLTMYKIPDGVSIEANSYLIIWCTGIEGYINEQYYAPFKISDGDTVYFTDSDGESIIDKIKVEETSTDESIGKTDNNSNEIAVFKESTPMRSNIGAAQKILKPSFSEKAGFFTEGFYLNITSNYQNGEIYYTLDGSEPTEKSRKYNGSIYIDSRAGEQNTISEIPTNNLTTNRAWVKPQGEVFKATVVKACVVVDGKKSETATSTFFVDKNISTRYGVSVVSVSTDNDNLFDYEKGIYVEGLHKNYSNKGKEWERPAVFEYFDKNGKRELVQNVGIRIHGAFSRQFPQKSLRVYARSEYGNSNLEYPFFENNGVKEFKSIILRNSGNDFGNMMFLDALYQHFWKENKNAVIQDFTPAVLFINGEFWGISNIREHYSQEYFASHFGGDAEKYIIAENANVAVDSGLPSDNITFINVSKFASNNDLNDQSNYDYVEKWIDLDNTAVYFAAEIFAGNNDWPGNNLGLFRYNVEPSSASVGFNDGRWRFFMKDIDQAYAYQRINYDAFSRIIKADTGKNYPVMLFTSLLKSDKFRNKFVVSLCDAMNTNLSKENIYTVTNQYKEIYRELIEEHISRWGSPQNFQVWESTVDKYKMVGNRRKLVIENQLKTYLPQITGKGFDGFNADLKLYVNDVSFGHIKINGINLSDKNNWHGNYPSGSEISLTAVPSDGYRFVGWEGDLKSMYNDINLTLKKGDNAVIAVFEPIAAE